MVIRTRMSIPDLWRGAKCRQLNISSWRNDPAFDRDMQDDMVEFCNEPEPCAIRHDCLLYALMNSCTDGVWGGMRPEDRRAMRRRYPLQPGTRNGAGTLQYHPRPEWEWLPPGQARALLTRRELAELEAGNDSETIRENGGPCEDTL